MIRSLPLDDAQATAKITVPNNNDGSVLSSPGRLRGRGKIFDTNEGGFDGTPSWVVIGEK